MRQRQLALLFCLKCMGDRAPTGPLLRPNRIQNSNPIQSLMPHPLTQPSRLMATEGISMGAALPR